jgi:hypothetical protein
MILSDLHPEDEIAERFGISARNVRERARAKGVGRKIGRKYWFTEAEGYALMDNPTCSNSRKGGIRQTGMRAGRISELPLTKALELATEGRRNGFSLTCKTKSSNSERVVPFGLRKGLPRQH